jgi:hypothetical protein
VKGAINGTPDKPTIDVLLADVRGIGLARLRVLAFALEERLGLVVSMLGGLRHLDAHRKWLACIS